MTSIMSKTAQLKQRLTVLELIDSIAEISQDRYPYVLVEANTHRRLGVDSQGGFHYATKVGAVKRFTRKSAEQIAAMWNSRETQYIMLVEAIPEHQQRERERQIVQKALNDYK